MVLQATHGVTNDVVIHETASRNYDLEIDWNDDRVVMVDGLMSPLISLQYGTVKTMLKSDRSSVLIFCFRVLAFGS